FSRPCHLNFVARVGMAVTIPPTRRRPMGTNLILAVASVAFGLSGAALAAGGGGGGGDPIPAAPAKPVDPSFAQGKALVEAKRYQEAMPYLQQAVAKNPRNADAYNLMGYATRKSGNANGSLQYYNQALAIDPKHLGAHEYIGEAYLQL